MPRFIYRALDRVGQEQSGALDALGRREAGTILRTRGLRVVQLEQESLTPSERAVRVARQVLSQMSPSALLRRLPVRASDQIFFFRQMALMISSGNTVIEALRAAGPLAGKVGMERSCARMVEAIQAGSSLSRAVNREKRVFPPLAAELIASGEAGGELDTVLERIAATMERDQDTRRELFRATLYPAIVMLFAVVLLWVMIHYVVPAYSTFLAARQIAMPFLLGRLIAMSDWMDLYGIHTLVGLGLTVFLLLAAYTTKRGKLALDRVLLHLPLVGSPIKVAAMARFCHTMAMLLGSGMTVLEGLRVVSDITANAALSRNFLAVREIILRGGTLSDGLRQPHIPPMIRQMAAVGEKSGELDRILAETGRFYDRLIDARVKVIVAWIEPVMILVVGGVVGLIYFAIYQAILRVATGGM